LHSNLCFKKFKDLMAKNSQISYYTRSTRVVVILCSSAKFYEDDRVHLMLLFIYSGSQATGVLRQLRGAEVLPDAACQAFLQDAIGPAGVEVMPMILCIGRYRPWRTQVWKQTGRLALLETASQIFLFTYTY
jgi:hypothetical protein